MPGYKCEDDQYFLNAMRAIIQASEMNNLNRFSQEEQRVLVSKLDYFGHSFLFYATYNNDYETAAYLVQLGACPCYCGEKGMLPIEVARKHHNKNIEELFSGLEQDIAHKERCDLYNHVVLHKKYSMETESNTEDLNPILNRKLPPEVQKVADCIIDSEKYPTQYVVRSSFKLPMPKRQKARFA
ncbi:hypothetical protein [Cardinium endosymbiont of Dermatophagoides farinae]|uniref:hypothetical protein n=1 Tax=Cardinium endosymbiont of Dermatophagoides farinae TaxID=2597823 RepID=UPI0016424D5A|nr:hypothetical protein [Cardinium endosymbiont of Dermatophagoides farinae]